MNGKVEVKQAWATVAVAAVGLAIAAAQVNIPLAYRLSALVLGLAGAAAAFYSWPWDNTLHKRLGIAGASLLVCAIAIVAVAPDPDAPKANLSLGALSVSGGMDGAEETIDVTVHNLGTRNVLLTSIDLTIRQFAYIPVCGVQGGVGVSGEYVLTMPGDPKGGQAVSALLHEEVPADAVDRFTLHASSPLKSAVVEARSRGLGGSFVYRVDLALHSDVETKALALGSAIWALPYSPTVSGGQLWNTADPSRMQFAQEMDAANAKAVADCLDENSRQLETILKLPGARSAEMDRMTRNGFDTPGQAR